MTSKLVVNTIEADTGISSVSFASSISMSSTSKFHFGDAGIDIGADTNINRPAAGVLGFNINSTEKFRIDSSGRIIQNYAAIPSVSSNLPYAYFAPTKKNYGGVDLTMNLHDDASNALGNGGGIGFSANNSSGSPVVRGAIRGNTEATDSTAGYLSFFTRPASGNNTERLRIDSSGNVTISTGNLTIPNSIIHSGDTDTKIAFGTNEIDFQAAGASRFKVTQYATYVQSGHPLAFLATGGGATPHIKSGGTNNQDLLFTTGTGNPTRLRINSTGNMSLGGIDPVPTSTSYNTASFHIHQTTNASNVGAQVHLTTANKGSAAGDGAQISQYNGNLYINNQDDGNMYFLNNSNSTIRMTITSGGALGFAGANYGTAGQVLKSGGSGAAPTWGDAGGLTTEIYAYISFGSTYDSNSGYVVHNISSLQSGSGITCDTSNERLTPTTAGKYLVIYMCNWLFSFSGGATFYNRITKNGSEQQRSTFAHYDPGSHTNITMCVMTMNGSSDYVQFEGYDNKSGQTAQMGNLSRAVMFKLRD